MMSLELLAIIGAGAVLPYVAEGTIDWLKHHVGTANVSMHQTEARDVGYRSSGIVAVSTELPEA